MFILYVQQVVVDEAFKKQEAKDRVCLYTLFLVHVLVFYPLIQYVLLLGISHTDVRMYVHYIHAACMQDHVCNMPLYTCVQDVITDETVQQQGTPDGVSLCNCPKL